VNGREKNMSALVQWLFETSASSTIRDIDWLIPALQSVHILAIAMVLSSLFMIDMRILKATRSQTLSLADTMHRFEAWIWTGLVILAASGAPLIVAEPQRTLPNSAFQLKLLLLALATTTTCALCISLRRTAEFRSMSGNANRTAKALAVGASLLWCAVAAAGRFIAYTQPA
jgi:hypothetical protein